MARRFSTSIEIDANPERVWAVMSDIDRWHEWTPTITSIERQGSGPLAVGLRARIRQPKLPPADWTVTSVEANRGFTWESRGPGVRVTARHAIEPGAAGALATLSLEFNGVVGRLIGWFSQRLNNRYLALEAAGLKRRSEESPSRQLRRS